MKIGFVYDVLYPHTIGGVEKRIYEIGKRLQAKGDEVHLFGMKYWDGPDTIEKKGMILHGVMPARPLYCGSRRSFSEAVLFAVRLFPVLLKEQIDIIECQNFPYFTCFTSKLVSFLHKTPLVIVWHEYWGDYWYEYLGKPGFLGIIIEKICTKLTPYTLADTKTVADMMAAAGCPYLPEVIACGINSYEISQVSPSDLESDIIFAGRLIPEKHPELVVLAVDKIRKNFPDVSCVIIGDGPERDVLLKLIEEKSLGKNVIMKGFVREHSEILGMMKSSKVFVLPSEREGFGIVGIEAIACGISFVTVAHRRNAAQELVSDWNGRVCNPDPDSLAQGILACLKTGNKGNETKHREYCQKHDWDYLAELARQYYLRVLTEKR